MLSHCRTSWNRLLVAALGLSLTAGCASFSHPESSIATTLQHLQVESLRGNPWSWRSTVRLSDAQVAYQRSQTSLSIGPYDRARSSLKYTVTHQDGSQVAMACYGQEQHIVGVPLQTWQVNCQYTGAESGELRLYRNQDAQGVLMPAGMWGALQSTAGALEVHAVHTYNNSWATSGDTPIGYLIIRDGQAIAGAEWVLGRHRFWLPQDNPRERREAMYALMAVMLVQEP